MDRLRAMQTYVRVVEGGSLTAAARVADASLPSVVRVLATLERELGTRLLNRTTRRMALTEEGRDYYERCRRILADVADAEASLSARHRAPRGRLVLGSSVLFGRLHLAPVVTGFLARYPEVKVELLMLDRVVNLLEEGIDATVRIGALADSALVAIPVGSVIRVVCASPDYLARRGVPRAPADLERHDCVRFTALTHGVEWEFRAKDKPPRVRVDGPFATNQVDAAVDACVAGLGCGMFLSYQVQAHERTGRLKRVLASFEPPAIPVSLVYPQARLMSARLRAFVDWAVPALRKRLAAPPRRHPFNRS